MQLGNVKSGVVFCTYVFTVGLFHFFLFRENDTVYMQSLQSAGVNYFDLANCGHYRALKAI